MRLLENALNRLDKFLSPNSPDNLTLREMYWHMEPALRREEVGEYNELCLGWIYDGLFDQDRHAVRDPRRPVQGLSQGWYRHQLAVL